MWPMKTSRRIGAYTIYCVFFYWNHNICLTALKTLDSVNVTLFWRSQHDDGTKQGTQSAPFIDLYQSFKMTQKYRQLPKASSIPAACRVGFCCLSQSLYGDVAHGMDTTFFVSSGFTTVDKTIPGVVSARTGFGSGDPAIMSSRNTGTLVLQV